MVGWMDGWMEGWMEGWISGWRMDGWMEGLMGGWMDGRIIFSAYVHICYVVSQFVIVFIKKDISILCGIVWIDRWMDGSHLILFCICAYA